MGLVWPPLLCARPLPVRQLLRGMCPEEPPRAGAVGEDISAVRVLRRLPLHVTCVGGGGCSWGTTNCCGTVSARTTGTSSAAIVVLGVT